MKEENKLFHPSNRISNTDIGTNMCELVKNKFRLNIEKTLQTVGDARL